MVFDLTAVTRPSIIPPFQTRFQQQAPDSAQRRRASRLFVLQSYSALRGQVKIQLGGGSMRHKKIATIILACACFAGMMQTARAQETKVNEDKGIAGYLNTKTGAFTPMAQKVADTDALAAIVATTGKFVFNFTLTVTSTVPKNGLVLCEGDANVFESSTGQSIF